MAAWNCHILIMGKTEKCQLLQNYCRYFNKTFIECSLRNRVSALCVLAHCSYLLIAMETKMQKNNNDKTKINKIFFLRHHRLYETEALSKYSSYKTFHILCFCFFFLCL